MTTTQKIIQPKTGLLKLAGKLGNVSAACKVMGIQETAFTVSGSCMKKAENLHSSRSAAQQATAEAPY